MDLVREFEKQQVAAIERPQLQPGDIVRVSTQVKEGDKTRIQAFEGTVLAIRGSGPSVTFTVRREVARFGVERIFPLYSPLITNIEIVKRQKVRRAKLNYLRHEGRRRFREDVKAMQRHVKEEDEKKRIVEEAKKREEEKKAKEESAKKRAEAEAQKAADEKAEKDSPLDKGEQEGVAEKTPETEAKPEPEKKE